MWTTYVCIVCDSQFTLSFISNVMKMNQALGTNSHLSKIPTASARLQACIRVLRQIAPNPAPILFVGDGFHRVGQEIVDRTSREQQTTRISDVSTHIPPQDSIGQLRQSCIGILWCGGGYLLFRYRGA
jgi:hypothetical protein